MDFKEIADIAYNSFPYVAYSFTAVNSLFYFKNRKDKSINLSERTILNLDALACLSIASIINLSPWIKDGSPILTDYISQKSIGLDNVIMGASLLLGSVGQVTSLITNVYKILNEYQ